MAGPVFRRDLYRGTAGYYDRIRPPYPAGLIGDLADRAGADGTGRLLDLACGTGQLGFALQDRFAEIWAVDQEPEMVAVVRDKAQAAGLSQLRAAACAALSTSVLSPVALGGQATEFTADLRRELLAVQPDGRFQQTIIFAYDLARRPA